MKKFSILAMLLFTTTLFSFVNAPAKFSSPSAGTTTVEVIDMTGFTVTIPCTGEVVVFAGNMVIVNTLNVNGNRYNFHTLFNPQQLSGTGSYGNTYIATGNTQHRGNGSFNNGQAIHHFVNNFRMIGQGSAANFTVHGLFHLTFNANNELTALIDLENASCD